MKKIAVLIFMLWAAVTTAAGQALYKGQNGKIKFFSEATLENIEAETNKASSLYNESTGEVAILIPVKSFVFKRKLMQEHFNENYMESDKYPDASFAGKIKSTQPLKGVTRQVVDISGTLSIHGVSKQRDIQATLTLNTDGTLSAKGKFIVKLEDHNVKIPSLLFQNIAEMVEVTFEFTLR